MDDINNKNKNKKLDDSINTKNYENTDNKYKDLFIRPNNTGLMNHLKKENEKLRKLIISYELKLKKNKYKIANDKISEFAISKFNFNIIKNSQEIKASTKNISKDYKYNYLNKTVKTAKKSKNITRMKKTEIRKIKDINLFDNDLSYMKTKEDLYKKYINTQAYTNNISQERNNRNNSLAQRNRRLLNINNNHTINSSTMRVKNVIINKNINNYILKPFQNNLSSNRSHSKIIKRRNINDNSSIHNTYAKTIENRKNINSSLEMKKLLKNSVSKQKDSKYNKKNKNKENKKEIYYQKPIINKIIFYTNPQSQISNLQFPKKNNLY